MSPHFQLLPARHNLFFLALLLSHFVSGTQAYYYYYGETDQERHDRNIERIIGASIALGLLLLIIPAYLYYARRKKARTSRVDSTSNGAVSLPRGTRLCPGAIWPWVLRTSFRAEWAPAKYAASQCPASSARVE
ncbi:hypothetical protein MVEN_00692000 [Mycena venus]|uniref:Uncharacterized protein n=1 Tax=Mycena venus TaxID=2733690 RepID=A0A8H6YJE1_9AGAR|nr:hypothetical protein MVEN_00692000 [Mycena venus]